MSWGDVEKWQDRAAARWCAFQLDATRHGWLLVRTNDGLWGARRLREGDIPGLFPDDPPEMTALTPELLLASIQARVGKGASA